MSTNLHLRATVTSSCPSSPKTKPPPKPPSIPTQYHYTPSPDGIDENLLILLHGLGDTHIPFVKLGRSLNLPQTATLSLCGPSLVPYLYESSYQWYPSFTPFGSLIPNPNPTQAITLLSSVFSHLTTHCKWSPRQIHLLGYAQGGTVALEFAHYRWKTQNEHVALGSVVSVSGGLLSYPTSSEGEGRCQTPVLIFHRSKPAEEALASGSVGVIRKGFESVKEVEMGGEGMPRSEEEWREIMEFWSGRLGRRMEMEGEEGVYEVVGERV